MGQQTPHCGYVWSKASQGKWLARNLCCLRRSQICAASHLFFLTGYEGFSLEMKGDHQIQDEIPPGISVWSSVKQQEPGSRSQQNCWELGYVKQGSQRDRFTCCCMWVAVGILDREYVSIFFELQVLQMLMHLSNTSIQCFLCWLEVRRIIVFAQNWGLRQLGLETWWLLSALLFPETRAGFSLS